MLREGPSKSGVATSRSDNASIYRVGEGLSGPGSHFTSLIETMMENGVKCFGGHARLITEGTEDILKGREQSWDEKRRGRRTARG